jgi:hypothetical protein
MRDMPCGRRPAGGRPDLYLDVGDGLSYRRETPDLAVRYFASGQAASGWLSEHSDAVVVPAGTAATTGVAAGAGATLGGVVVVGVVLPTQVRQADSRLEPRAALAATAPASAPPTRPG